MSDAPGAAWGRRPPGRSAGGPASPLKFLYPGWYTIVMGLAGLALAWQRAEPLMGVAATDVAHAVGALAAATFALLAVATVMRASRHPEAWAEDCRHPVRHACVATLPTALILLATVAVAPTDAGLPARVLWWAGSLSQVFVTAWVLGRWWRGKDAGGLGWPSVTPALFIPVVGNVLAPLAGVPLGHAEWAGAQFGVGLMLWPVVLVLLATRIAVAGMWPERLRPMVFMLIAPPAVVGLASLQFGAPPMVGWLLWGMALFSLMWVGPQAALIARQPFGWAHWGMGFPLAAFAALTLRLATPGGVLAVLGPVLLALASLLGVVLVLGTLRGLRDGTLLVPEPVAPIVAASSA